jgi:hypothetical protein
MDWKHIEPIKQVITKGPRLNARLQVSISGRDHPHLGTNPLVSTHPLKFAFLQDTQKRDLSLRREISDFVQKDRASVSQLESAGAPLQGARKCSLFMTEQFRGNQAWRDYGTIHAHERPRETGRSLVDGARDKFFAGACFARAAELHS